METDIEKYNNTYYIGLIEKIKILREHEIKWMNRQGFTDYHMGARDAYTKILGSLYQDLKKLME